MPSGEKQYPVSVKKVSLREFLTTSDNIMSKQTESPPPTKERGPMTDSVKTCGTKRQLPDCPSSPSSLLPHDNRGVSCHLVYVRRKLETERGKKNTLNVADSLKSSILSKRSDSEESKETKVPENTQKGPEISHSSEMAINGVETNDSAVISKTHAPVDPERSNNRDPNASVEPERPSNQYLNTSAVISKTHAPVDPERSNNLDPYSSVETERPSNQYLNTPVDPLKLNSGVFRAPGDHQRPRNANSNVSVDMKRPNKQECRSRVGPDRPNNQDCKLPADSHRLSNQNLNASVDPQRSNSRYCKAPVDHQRPRPSKGDLDSRGYLKRPNNQDSKAPDGPQRLRHEDVNVAVDPQRSVDPQRLRNLGFNGPIISQRLGDQNCNIPVDRQRSSNQDSEAPIDPQRQRASNQDWKERYLQLQMFLKSCDQSSQEDYKRMLRSLTAAGRSRHALELERRALHLLQEEGEELRRMQALNIVPSPQTSSAQSQFQRMEAMRDPKSPFFRNGH